MQGYNVCLIGVPKLQNKETWGDEYLKTDQLGLVQY